MNVSLSKWWFLTVAACLSAGVTLADNYRQDFDVGWTETVGFGFEQQTHQGWTAYDMLIKSGGSGLPPPPTGSEPFYCAMAYLNGDPGLPGNPYITSPLLSNGIGTLSYISRCMGSPGQVLAIETSTNGTNWVEFTRVTNSTVNTYVPFDVEMNIYEQVYLRMFKVFDNNINFAFLLVDAIEMTFPPSYVELSNVVLDPAEPYVETPVNVDITVVPQAGAHNIDATLHYSTDGGSSFSPVNMLSASSNRFITASPGIPAQTSPGSTVEYYVQVEFDGQTPGTQTNYWPENAPAVTGDFYLRWAPTNVFADTTFDDWGFTNGLVYRGDAWFNLDGQGTGTPALYSPLLNRGVGILSVAARNHLHADPIVFDIHRSDDGVTWDIPIATFTNTQVESFSVHQVRVDYYEPTYVRIRKVSDNGTGYHHLVFDAASASEPSSFVEISNVTLEPSPPQAGSNIMVRATIAPFAGANNIYGRIYYAFGENATRPFTSYIDMEPVGGNVFETFAGIPAPPTPGETMHIYVHVTFQGITPESPITDPETGTYAYMLRAPTPVSLVTDLTVTGGTQSTNMTLTTNHFWRGVLSPSSPLVSETYYFQDSGGTWGDTNQAMVVTPVFGDADAGSTFAINETLDHHILFQFRDGESNTTYSAAEAEYMNFDSWVGDTTYGNHVGPENWLLINGRLNTQASNELARAFEGRYAILKYSASPDEHLQSPTMTDGVGAVSFRYRNWNNAAEEPAAFQVRKSGSGTGPWTNVAAVTGILSADWLYFSVPVADRSARYISIRIDDSEVDSWLCLDDVAITEAGASVLLSNPQAAPAAPLLGDPVSASIDVAEFGGASDTIVNVRYRSGLTAPYAWAVATRNGNTFTASIPPGPSGDVYYYYECTFEGFEPAPTYYPPLGADDPLTFTVSSNLPATRIQRFDSGWSTTNKYGLQDHEGWTVSDTWIRGGGGGLPAPLSAPYACWMNYLFGDPGWPGNPWIESTFITNGIGSISFVAQGGPFDTAQVLQLETKFFGSPDWDVLATYTNTGKDGWITNSVYLNTYDEMYIRLHKVDDYGVQFQQLGIDNILITFPPSDAYVTNVYFGPVYPAQNQEVTVHCSVEQLNPNYPAFGFAPVIYHRQGGGWNTTPMSFAGGNQYAGDIPAYPPGIVEYFIRCDFDGVYYEDEYGTENRSPAFSPEAEHTDSEPASFYSYSVRYYRSDYESIIITGNFETVDSDMIGNDIWEGALYTGPTNRLQIGIVGVGLAANSLQEPGSNNWGDSEQWLTSIPTAGTLTPDGSNIVATGSFDGLYLVRLNLRTGNYTIVRVDYQDFDEWPLHATKFSEGSQGRLTQNWLQTFDDWPMTIDHEHATMFENAWSNYEGQAYSTEFEEGWLIEAARIVNTNNHRCELTPSEQSGRIYPSFGPEALNSILPGCGTMRFMYRATDTDPHPTICDTGSTWTNYAFQAICRGQGDNTDDECYWALIYRYQDSQNFYEQRVVAANHTELFFELWRTKGGTKTLLYTGGRFNGNLTGNGAFRIEIKNSGNVIQHRGKWDNVDRLLYASETTAVGLGNGGRFGLAAYDINMIVDTVSVDALSPDSFSSYSESFVAEPTDWDTSGAWSRSSGEYRRLNRYGDPITFVAATALPDDLALSPLWEIHQEFADVTTLNYVQVSVDLHRSETVYPILGHTDGAGSFRFDNVEVTSWRGEDVTNGTPPDAWVIADGRVSGEVPYRGRNLEMRASRGWFATNHQQYIRTPEVTTVGPITFRYRTPPGSPPADIELRWADTEAPEIFSTLTNAVLSSGGAWSRFSFPLDVISTGYIQVAHVSADMDTRLFIDELNVFDYHALNTNAWIVYNALLTDEQQDKLFLDDGQSCYLNHDDHTDTLFDRQFTNSAAYLQSPYLPNGIGEISFWYRRWPVAGGLSNSILRIEMSPDTSDGSWDEVAELLVPSDVYQRHVIEMYDPGYHFLRFYNATAGGVPDRLCLDNVLVADPIATDLLVTNVYTVPAVPVFTNSVKIRADLTDFILGPSNIQVRAFYHVGSDQWGAWPENTNDSLGMVLVGSDTNARPPVYTYETVSSITSHPPDTVVQYVVRADFDGLVLADISSPRRFKEEFQNPAVYEPMDYNEQFGGGVSRVPYYVVLSCPPGSVWINEINILENTYPWGEKEYVELCGPAGIDISNWKLTIENSAFQTSGVYSIQNNALFFNETNGFGFWVLGDNIPAIAPDQTFTNTPDVEGNHMPHTGGIKLFRNIGSLEEAVCYYSEFGSRPDALLMELLEGFTLIDLADGWLDTEPLGLVGTGGVAGAFTWSGTSGGYTPGGVNGGQTLVNMNDLPTEIWITGCWSDPATTWLTYTATREITPTAWYATNLPGSNWTQITGGGYNGAGGSYTQWFDLMTGSPAYFYRIEGEDGE